MSIVEKYLSSIGLQCLIYADDLVTFISNKHLYLTVKNLKIALKDLSDILIRVSFEVAPKKSKSVIFKRCRYLNYPNILLDSIIIRIVPNVTYVGIALDSKLRFLPHINSVTAFAFQWSIFSERLLEPGGDHILLVFYLFTFKPYAPNLTMVSSFLVHLPTVIGKN